MNNRSVEPLRFPRRGGRVVEPLPYSREPQSLAELYELRELLDGASARQAARHLPAAELGALTRLVRTAEERLAADDLAADDLAGAAKALGAWDELLRSLLRNRHLAGFAALLPAHPESLEPERLAGSVRRHRDIHEAIIRRDPAEAERLMRLHVMTQLADELATLPAGARRTSDARHTSGREAAL